MKLQSSEILLAFIAKRGISQATLGRWSGCSPSFISQLTTGARNSCSKELAERITEALDVPIAALFVEQTSSGTSNSSPSRRAA